jgi:hypothetical protein
MGWCQVNSACRADLSRLGAICKHSLGRNVGLEVDKEHENDAGDLRAWARGVDGMLSGKGAC